MPEQKAKAIGTEVEAFLAGIEDAQKRQDSEELVSLIARVTGEEPEMWSHGMVGFGRFRYRYKSGHSGETFKAGFAPRKAALTIYLGYDAAQFQSLLDKLGKHRLGKGCLYVKRLADIDRAVLEQLVRSAVDELERSDVNLDKAG